MLVAGLLATGLALSGCRGMALTARQVGGETINLGYRVIEGTNRAGRKVGRVIRGTGPDLQSGFLPGEGLYRSYYDRPPDTLASVTRTTLAGVGCTDITGGVTETGGTLKATSDAGEAVEVTIDPVEYRGYVTQWTKVDVKVGRGDPDLSKAIHRGILELDDSGQGYDVDR